MSNCQVSSVCSSMNNCSWNPYLNGTLKQTYPIGYVDDDEDAEFEAQAMANGSIDLPLPRSETYVNNSGKMIHNI